MVATAQEEQERRIVRSNHHHIMQQGKQEQAEQPQGQEGEAGHDNKRKRKIEERSREDDEIAKLRAKLAKLDNLKNGKFYAPFTEVWNTNEKGEFSEEDMNLLQRKETPTVSVRVGCSREGSLNLAKVYSLTVDGLKESNRQTIVTDSAASSRGSSKTAEKNKVLWPADVFCNNMTGAIGEIAHLVPASPMNSSLYYNVAKWVFGKPEMQDFLDLNKLIQGYYYKMEDNKSEAKPHRIPYVGLKHFTCNKIRLEGQWKYFDQRPNLIIVPTLSRDRILAWDGESYDAIAMIGIKKEKEKKEVSLEDVARGVGFLNEGTDASDHDIEEARKNLVVALKALAASLVHGAKPYNLPQATTNELAKLKATHTRKLDGSKGLVLPSKRNVNESRLVRKISFVAQGSEDDDDDDDGKGGHPAPDPMLLLIKSAVNWSMYHGQQLLAAGEIDDDLDDDELSESSIFDIILRMKRENEQHEILGKTIEFQVGVMQS